MSRFLDRLHNLCMLISAAVILLLMASIIVDITFRLSIGKAAHGIVEYGEIGIVLCALVAVAYTQRQGGHVSVDSIMKALPRKAVLTLTWLSVVLVVPIMIWIAWEAAFVALDSYRSAEYRFGMAEVSIWPARAALPVGLLLWAVELLRQAILETLGLAQTAPATEVPQ